jgi:CcmD family protein
VIRALCLLVVLSLGVALPGAAQAPDTPVSPDAAAAPASPAASQSGLQATGSPGYMSAETAPVAGTAQPPRTLRAYWHVFIAFAVTLLLLFGYALSLGRRWARLEREVMGMAREARRA